jgi:hypothetical protein
MSAQRVVTAIGLVALAALLLSVGLPTLLPPAGVAEITIVVPESPEPALPSRPDDLDDDGTDDDDEDEDQDEDDDQDDDGPDDGPDDDGPDDSPDGSPDDDGDGDDD